MAREFLAGVEERSLACAGCGRKVWPRLGSYWFLLLAERGRCRFPGARSWEVVLCGPCGRRVSEELERQGIGGVVHDDERGPAAGG